MFISCPNCSTRYNVSAAQLGGGKSVKCSNCGNTWHQQPVADPPPPAMPRGGQHQQYAQPQQPYPYPPQGQPGYPPPPPGYPPYPYPPQGAPGYPPPGYPPQAEQPAPAPAPAPPPPPPPPPELVDEEEDTALPDMDDLTDDDPMAAFAVDDESEDDEDELSSEDIEAMFGDDDDDDGPPLGSMVEAPADDDEEEDEDIDDLDDLEEPEPIPQVFTAEETGDDEYEDDDEDEEEDAGAGKGSIMKIVLAAVLAIFVGLIAAAIFLKDMVVEFVPAAEGVYSMIGLGDDALGAGLSINDVKSTRESIAGKDVLVVRGVIVNVSDSERPVPMLELRLSDLDGKLVQSANTAPLKKQLTAGDQIGFKIQVEDPSPLARRLEVTFIERGGDGAPNAAQ